MWAPITCLSHLKGLPLLRRSVGFTLIHSRMTRLLRSRYPSQKTSFCPLFLQSYCFGHYKNFHTQFSPQQNTGHIKAFFRPPSYVNFASSPYTRYIQQICGVSVLLELSVTHSGLPQGSRLIWELQKRCVVSLCGFTIL